VEMILQAVYVWSASQYGNRKLAALDEQNLCKKKKKKKSIECGEERIIGIMKKRARRKTRREKRELGVNFRL
jgi:hypothetical protein